MKNILEIIVAHKKEEVAERKKQVAVNILEKSDSFSRACISLKESLKDPEKTGIIAEFKRKSPSKGLINGTADAASVTQKYARYGASGLSVLTDSHFFGGSNADLKKIRSVNNLPILRKEFIIEEYQILEAKSIGADVVLLIAECLSKTEMAQLARMAKSLGMEILLEMHSEQQLYKITPDVTFIGINNRDLATFEVDIDRSIQLAKKLPKEMVKIAESGINDPAVIMKMKQSGFEGFLMGEYFMKEEDPGEAFRQFVKRAKTMFDF